MLVLLLIPVAIICVCIYPYVTNYWKRKNILRLPHRPYYNPILGTLSTFPKDRSDNLNELLDSMSKYKIKEAGAFIAGPQAFLSVVGPKSAREILSSSKHTIKNFNYDFLLPWLGTGLLIAHGDKWKHHRRLITPAFHFDVLKRFLEVMNEQADTLITKMHAQSSSGPVEVFELITACALDIICETAMGKKVYAQKTEKQSPYVQAVYNISKQISDRFEKPWLWNDFVYSLTPSGQKNRQTLKILHEFTIKVIQERRKFLNEEKSERERKPAFLDILLQAQTDGENLSESDIREEVDTFMFEGHDTTSAAMAWSLQLIGLHPEVQEKLHEEIDSVIGDSNEVTSEMISQMPYLEIVMKESLRIYPSVPGVGRLLTEDIEIDGVIIPKGTQTLVNIYAINHNPFYWKNPEIFDPDRWLPENSEGRDPYLYVPFSAGPRNCIGQKFALYEEKVVIAKVLKNFKFTSLTKKPRMLPELILRPVDGIHLSLESRIAK